ncbi:hypothetical protein [Novispirillum itersonii]|uniref:hypothetical protein n=1 Tax=Novispirillum itersonii TaxID=189 RepID=UPI0012DE16A8|nr:hypothetical protein [Novispirillum itersonii]
MALSVEVQGYWEHHGACLWKMEAPWWKYEDFYRNPRSVFCGPNSSYNDREMWLTLTEAQDCHRRYLPYVLTSVKYWEDRCQQLGESLESLKRKGWFHREGVVRILVFEFP